MRWTVEERLANETRSKNDGRIICAPCSRHLKRAGRSNPHTKYRTVDDGLLEVIDSEEKAYLLGWFASDGSIRANTIALYIHKKDRATLVTLRDLVARELPVRAKGNLVGFAVNSARIAADACRWLGITPGKKSSTVQFPKLSSPELQWAFLRGLFDGDGSVSSVDAATRRKRWPAPRCNLASNSPGLLDGVAAFCGVRAYRGRDQLQWSGTNALDLLGRLYDRSSLHLARKRDLYLDWCCWAPMLTGSGSQGVHPLFRWARVLPDAKPPAKAATSDSGFDLTLIERAKVHGQVEFFRTGIRVQPAFGWYFDLVPRSSISKSGYMLANSVGVIDRGYTGEILVPLIKISASSPDLELPARIVQIIPRTIIAAEFVEVESLDESVRGSGGFGSTGT